MHSAPSSPTWQTFRDDLDRAARPGAWTTAARWALDALSEHLGRDWPQRALAVEARDGQQLPFFSALMKIGSHTIALAQALEWALRLRLLQSEDGFADLKRDLRGDLTVGRILHTDLELLVAGLARRAGWPLRLEPTLARASPPADVLIDSPTARLSVEVRVLTERVGARERRQRIDDVVDHLTLLAATRSVWLEGSIGEPLDDVAVEALERWIESESPNVHEGRASALRLGSTDVRLVQRRGALGSLRSAAVTDDLWPRTISAIASKARRMSESGASWLRLTLLTGFFAFTPWAQRPLDEKLDMLADSLRSSLGDEIPHGVVVSSGAARFPGPVPEEVAHTEAGIAIRCGVSPLRGRETLILPFTAAGNEAAMAWLDLARNERDWLQWAMSQAGLPDLSEIAGTLSSG
jgi:hypothetical protein